MIFLCIKLFFNCRKQSNNANIYFDDLDYNYMNVSSLLRALMAINFNDD
jgi:hypothetical protein